MTPWTEASARPPVGGPGRFAFRAPALVLTLLTGFNLLNYIDRFIMSAVLPKVRADLHLSNTMAGALGTVLLGSYFATSPFFGSLADRAAKGGRKRLMTLGVSVWSAATFASGLARGFASLVAARVFVGIGEASYGTIAPALIDDVVTPEKKGRAMAVFNAAIPVGSALGFIIGGVVEHRYGWTGAFMIVGAPGLLLALLCLLIDEPPRYAVATPPVLASARTLLAIAPYRGAVLGYSAYTFAIGGFAYWAPTYIATRYDLDPGVASKTFGLLTVASGLAGTLLGGFLADVLRRSAPDANSDGALVRASLSVCALASGLGAPFAAAAIVAGTSARFFALLVPCEIALFMASGPVNLALLRTVPDRLRASAMAFGIFAIHLLGDLWSPLVMGALADYAPGASEKERWVVAMMAAPVVFAIAAFLWWRASARLTWAVAVR